MKKPSAPGSLVATIACAVRSSTPPTIFISFAHFLIDNPRGGSYIRDRGVS